MPKCTWKIEEYQPPGQGFVPQLVRSETPAVLRFSACPLLVCLALPCCKKKIGLAQLLHYNRTFEKKSKHPRSQPVERLSS